MKLRFLITVLALWVFAGLHAEGFRSVAIEMADGSSVGVNLSDNLITTFVENEIRFKQGFKVVLSLERSKVKEFNFSESVSLAEPSVESGKGILNFSNLAQGAAAQVADMSGRVVLTVPAEEGNCSVSLSGLPHGVYVVTAGSISLKISE